MVRVPVVLLLATACGHPPEAPPSADPLRAAKTITTGCAGSAYSKVQDAISNASAGDVIEICSGTYAERLTISGKVLTLKPQSGASVTVDGTGGGRTISVTGGADVTIDGLTIRNGYATGTGGNVYCSGSDLELRNSVLEDGLAAKGGGAGFKTCTGVIEGNTFRDNRATSKGGGLYTEGTIDVRDNRIEANASDDRGGGAYVKGSFGEISGNTVVANTSIDDGGGIYVYDGAPIVDGNTFDLNVAESEGGGLRVKIAEAIITNNTLTGNQADSNGGGTRVSHDEVVMAGNVFVGNKSSWGSGGGAYMHESASLLSFETYVDNDADEGGGVAIEAGWGDIELTDCTFEDNEGDKIGGNLWISLPGYTTHLQRVDLVGGTSPQGAGIYAIGSEIELENVLLEGNVATTGGGAIYLDATTGEIVNAVLSANSAPLGAGMQVVNGAALTVSNTIFHGNTSSAAVTLTSGLAPTITYSDFYANTSNYSGIVNPVGKNGNLAVSPGFVNPTPPGDYHLVSTSGVKDKGDPAISDQDGSRSDMGLYGGPYAQ